MDPEFAAFHNRLRLMLSIDFHQLVEAGVMDANDHRGWAAFSENPWRSLIRMDDERAEKVWRIMEGPR